jgi:hypothetical protein
MIAPESIDLLQHRHDPLLVVGRLNRLSPVRQNFYENFFGCGA